MNNIILTGRLCADPETGAVKRSDGNDVAFTKFRLAVKRYEKDKDDDFFKVIAWGHTAKFISDGFKKGSRIELRGEIHNNNWTDKNGNKRYDFEVTAESVGFVDPKPKDKADWAGSELIPDYPEDFRPDFTAPPPASAPVAQAAAPVAPSTGFDISTFEEIPDPSQWGVG